MQRAISEQAAGPESPDPICFSIFSAVQLRSIDSKRGRFAGLRATTAKLTNCLVDEHSAEIASETYTLDMSQNRMNPNNQQK